MADAISYCDTCSKLISPADVRSGAAVVSQTAALCPGCIAALGPERRDALLRGTRSTRRSGTPVPRRGGDEAVARTRRTPVPGPRRAPASRKMPVPVIAAGSIVAGIVGGLALYLLIASDDGAGPESAPPAPVGVVAPPLPPPVGLPTPATSPVAPSAAPRKVEDSAAARRLAKIRSRVDEGGGDYAEIRAMLEDVGSLQPTSVEADEARRLLDRIDSAYAARAEKALADAVDAARALASRGDYDVAVSGIRSIASRFGEGPWLSATGKGLIAKAIAEVEETKRAAAAALAEGRAGVKIVGLPAGMESLHDTAKVVHDFAVHKEGYRYTNQGSTFESELVEDAGGTCLKISIKHVGREAWVGLGQFFGNLDLRNCYGLSLAARCDSPTGLGIKAYVTDAECYHGGFAMTATWQYIVIPFEALKRGDSTLAARASLRKIEFQPGNSPRNNTVYLRELRLIRLPGK